MPTVTLHPPPRDRTNNSTHSDPLPSLVQTPSGLALIELQGTISSEEPEPEAALTLGRLVFPPPESDEHGEWDGKRVMLYVGDHQRLTGDVRKLAKPIAVVRRKPVSDHDSTHVDDEVEIVEIVNYKMLFAHRPEPLGGQQQGQPEDH